MGKVEKDGEIGWSIGRNPWCVGFIDWLLKINIIALEEIDAAYSILNPFYNYGGRGTVRQIQFYFHDYENLEDVEKIMKKFFDNKILVQPEDDVIELSGCAKLWMYHIINIHSSY